MADPQESARSADALRRWQAWRTLSLCEAQLGGVSRSGVFGARCYDSQGRNFLRAPSFQLRDDHGGRVSRIRAALEDSPRLAMQELARRFDQLDFGVIAPILSSLVHDIALYIGTGAVAGAGLGFFFGGGVGAVPGLALGAEAGTLALNLIGMASLIGELSRVLPDALRHYLQGFREAWGAIPEPGQPNLAGSGVGLSASASYGAHEIAQGHVLILAAVVMGIMLWISKGGVGRSKLLAEIRANPRMGAPMANWVEASESRFPKQLEDLANRDALAGGKGALPKAAPVPAKPAVPPAAGAKPSGGTAAPSRYGSIPPEHQARYDRYLNGPSAKKLGPDQWYAAAQRAWANNAQGNSFEQAVRTELGAPVGAGSKPVSIDGFVPDLPVGDTYGVTDIKNLVDLSNSEQLRAFQGYAADNNLPFNLIISPRTQSISGPLLDGIRETGGSVIEYNPVTQDFTPIDIGSSGPWTR